MEEELKGFGVMCFSCNFAYSCKYYQNILWDWWIVANPEDGCPALKYPFDSLYKAIAAQKKYLKNKEEKGKKDKWQSKTKTINR